MRKWVSNSKEVMKSLRESQDRAKSLQSPSQQGSVTEEDRGYAQSVFSKENDTNPRVLGQECNRHKDELNFEFSKVLTAVDSEIITKWIVLCATAKFYDPVGLISPVVLEFKRLFQDLC